MTLQPFSYPALPEDTLRAATLLYGRGNVYLRLGDHLDELLLGLDLGRCQEEGKSLENTVQCAMLTVFQFVEELPNRLMVEALRKRTDLKYALHLSLNSPYLDGEALCNFRRHLFIEPASMLAFQVLVQRLEAFSLITPCEGQPVNAQEILMTVCSLNRFDEILEAMYQVLESLAISDPEWLRKTMLPTWYERYNRRRGLPHVPFADQRWHTRVFQIGVDIRYLLDEIDKSDNSSLAALRETQEVRHQWDEQFIPSFNQLNHQQAYEWSFSRCASCKMAIGLTQ